MTIYIPANNNWGLLGQAIGGMIKRGREADAWQGMVDAQNNISGLDYGAQPQLNDQTPTGYGAKDKAVSGLLSSSGIGFTDNSVPTADDIGKGLLSGVQNPTNKQPFTYNQAPTPDQPTAQDIQAPQTSYNQAVQGNVTMTAPKSLSEAKMMTNKAVYQAAANIAKQYGPEYARQFLPMLQQTANDRVSAYQNDYNQQKQFGLMQQFNDSKNPMERAMIAAQLKNYGLELNPKMISTLQPDYKMSVVNNGDSHSLILHNPKDGSVMNAGNMQINVSPDAQLRASTSLQVAQIRGAGRGGGGGGRGGGAKLGKAESWAAGYENTGLPHDNAVINALYGKDGLSNSEQIQLDQALGRRDQYWKVSSGGQYTGGGSGNTADYENATPATDYVRQQVRAAYPDASEDEIAQFIAERYQ